MPHPLKFCLAIAACFFGTAALAFGQEAKTLWDLPAYRASTPTVTLETERLGVSASPSASSSSEDTQPHAAGGGSKTSGGDPTTTGRAQEVGNRHLGKLALKSHYDYGNDGFRLATDDDEYSFGVRGMVQLDARGYPQPSPGFATSGFYNPRSRFYFEGNFTKPIQYEFSFQNTFDSTALLDAYVNVNYDPRLQFRIGRYKTPFTYEWYRVHIWDTLAPERSLYANNYESNRRFGAMLWGGLLEQRVEYAVGIFNSQRNSLRAFSNRQDLMAFLNFKPFYNKEGSVLSDLQFGGSVDAGNPNQQRLPSALRTNSAPSGNDVGGGAAGDAATIPFLAFNSNVIERGGRALWELHTAYYGCGWSFLAAWQSGYESYANGANGPKTRISIDGWFVQAGYLITGETIRDRTLVDPLRPFDLRAGRFGLGAFEPTARYSELELSPDVFINGLADATKWTNRAQLIDVGFNWYWNKFIKIYLGWERAIFGTPVFSNSGAAQKTNDMFWLRTQLYF